MKAVRPASRGQSTVELALAMLIFVLYQDKATTATPEQVQLLMPMT